MFTVNNKDSRMTPLTLLILNIANIDILNLEQLLRLILVFKLLTYRPGNSLLRRMISQIKTLKKKSFLPFNFAITMEILKFVLRYV